MKRISNLARMTKKVDYENSRGFVPYNKACEIIEACLDTLQKFNINPDKCPAAHCAVEFLKHGFGFASDFKAYLGTSRVFRYIYGEKVLTGEGQLKLEMLVRSIDNHINSHQ